MTVVDETPPRGAPGRQVAWAYTVLVRHRPRWRVNRGRLRRRCDRCQRPAPCAYYQNAALVRDRHGASAWERRRQLTLDRSGAATVMLPRVDDRGGRLEPMDWAILAALACLGPALIALVVYRVAIWAG